MSQEDKDIYSQIFQEVVLQAPPGPIFDMATKAWATIRRHDKIKVAISGGQDSDIMLDLFVRLDVEKKATYVYFKTGMEYEAPKRHLKELQEKYDIKIEEIPPILQIPTCCRKYGVPFWSKRVSENIYRLQSHGFKWEDKPFQELLQEYPKCKSALQWWCNAYPKKDNGKESSLNIAYAPWLKEFITENHPPKISTKCCEKAKKQPADKYDKEHDFDLACTGVRKKEKGIRSQRYSTCFSKHNIGPDTYRPLFWLSDADKKEYMEHYGVTNSDCYTVWGMDRTGCPGCPYGKNFEQELELMQKYEPKFYRACIKIFGGSYDYTRAYLRFRDAKKREAKGGER